MNWLIGNLKHIPSTSIGTLMVILAGLTQVPGFQNLCKLSPGAGTIITYISGIAGLILITCWGKSPNGIAPNKYTGILLALCALCLCSIPASAQTADSNLPTYMFGVGVGFDQSTDSTLMGYGWYARQVKDTFYSFSGYSAERVPGAVSKLGTVNLPRFKFIPFTGYAVRVLQVSPKLSLWQSTTGGVATTGDTVTGNLGMDGFLRYVIKGSSGIVAGLHFSHDAISGDGFSARLVYNFAGK